MGDFQHPGKEERSIRQLGSRKHPSCENRHHGSADRTRHSGYASHYGSVLGRNYGHHVRPPRRCIHSADVLFPGGLIELSVQLDRFFLGDGLEGRRFFIGGSASQARVACTGCFRHQLLVVRLELACMV
jgi:hypothetical protein